MQIGDKVIVRGGIFGGSTGQVMQVNRNTAVVILFDYGMHTIESAILEKRRN